MNFLSHVGRFVVAALVLMVVGWIVPQFTVGGFWSALILALVIALLGWVVEGIFGKKQRLRSRYRRLYCQCGSYLGRSIRSQRSQRIHSGCHFSSSGHWDYRLVPAGIHSI